MKRSNNLSKLSIFATGSLFLGSLTVSATPVTTSNNLYDYTDLGSGGNVRSEILNGSFAADYFAEAACGNKSSEAKCGEGKCGEKKVEKKSEKKEAKATKKSKKSSKKAKTNKESKKVEKKESKTSEHKCGEGKCGEGKCGSE